MAQILLCPTAPKCRPPVKNHYLGSGGVGHTYVRSCRERGTERARGAAWSPNMVKVVGSSPGNGFAVVR